MKIKQPTPFLNGINSIVEINGPHRDYLMDFKILKMKKGDIHRNNSSLERAYLLIHGEIKVTYDGKTEVLSRENFYDFDPLLVHLCKDTEITIECLNEDTEISIFASENEALNRSKTYYAEDVVVEVRGKGTMNDTGTRITRTIIDYSIDPVSNLMIGEDMHYPGKWAGFPSHHHEQPEIYFYKFTPTKKRGFGLIKLGDEGFLLEENDTLLIPPGYEHPQVAAPGYGMYFIFAIRHLDGNPYIKPTYVEEHLWAGEPDAVIWPNKG